MEKHREREHWIDCLKGIAIALVVLGHFVKSNHPLSRWIHSFHMPLFFMISGVLLGMRQGFRDPSLRSLLLRRAKQLLYPYVMFSVVAAVYSCLRGRMDQAARVVWYTVSLEGHNTLWFLPALWMAEGMLYVIQKYLPKKKLVPAVLVAGTSLYAAVQYYALGGGSPAEAGLHYQILNGFCRAGIGCVFLMAGYYGAAYLQRLEQEDKKKKTALSCAAFALGAVCGLVNGWADLHYGVQANPVLYYLAALLQSGSLIVLFSAWGCRCGALEWWGRNSLTIMATHYPLPVINFGQWVAESLNSGLQGADAAAGLLAVIVAESALVLLVNRCFPWLLRLPKGKRRTAA